MSRSKKGRRRRVRVAPGRQMPLLAGSAAPAARAPSSRAASVRFNDPNPESLFVGTGTLRSFLESSGEHWVFAMRKLLRGMDWSALESKHKPGGRPPYHPAAILGLILLGMMQGMTSLRAMEAMGRFDVRCWWLTGGVSPDHTMLCRFLQLHADELTEQVFEDLTGKVLAALGSSASSVAVDATVTQAAASRYRLLQQEAAEQAAHRARSTASANPGDKRKAAAASRAEEAVERVRDRNEARRLKGKPRTAKVAPSEPDAALQRGKRGGAVPSYKPAVAVNEDRVIVGHAVETTGEASAVKGLVDQAERASGQAVEHLMADAGYNTAQVLQLALEREIDLLCPLGKSSSSGKWEPRTGRIGKRDFTYDERRDRYKCPAGRWLTPIHDWHKRKSDTTPTRAYLGPIDCTSCDLASRCLRKAERRMIRRYQHDEHKDAMQVVMSQPGARKRYRKRQGMVEPVFGELRHTQSLGRFRRRGLANVRLEFALHCMAHNLRRMAARARLALQVHGRDAPGSAWHRLGTLLAELAHGALSWLSARAERRRLWMLDKPQHQAAQACVL